jgi:aryl-alcohol dehydrogenase-like predicted oxidoreductase
VRTALDGGLTYFDTAAQYGDGLSEENLGRALAELGATNQAVIGTKVRLAAGDLAEPAAAIRASLSESLQRLRRDYLDAYVLHNFPRSQVSRDYVFTEHLGGIAGAMRQLQQEGLVRSIGFTCVGDTPALHEAIETGLFDFAQCYYNVLNASAAYAGACGGGQDFDGVIEQATAMGATSMSVRTVAGGALVASDYRSPVSGPTGSGGGLGGNPYANDLARAQALQPLARSLGLESVLELGVRFNISHPGVATALIGFADQAEVAGALRWADRGPLPASAIAEAVKLARA